ncbi:hypothetical protein PsYK624_024490 [Phanerochaete sordida]|uniref:Uncharacterized protein n=1 Tax=Phanerochaete sordida TaxID=48140 RepID=A0A9P3G1W6_9APHY|nr:hypothetical protein PsYK624_024490 [Phanerochaete sordida]
MPLRGITVDGAPLAHDQHSKAREHDARATNTSNTHEEPRICGSERSTIFEVVRDQVDFPLPCLLPTATILYGVMLATRSASPRSALSFIPSAQHRIAAPTGPPHVRQLPQTKKLSTPLRQSPTLRFSCDASSHMTTAYVGLPSAPEALACKGQRLHILAPRVSPPHARINVKVGRGHVPSVISPGMCPPITWTPPTRAGARTSLPHFPASCVGY